MPAARTPELRPHLPDTPEQVERRRQVRGLLVLAVLAITFAIFRAGIHRVFTVDWWRLW